MPSQSDSVETNMNPGKKLAESARRQDKQSEEIDATYAAIRSLVAQAETLDSKSMRVALAGLLPEVQRFEPETERRMREKGMGHMVDLHNDRVERNWCELMGTTSEPFTSPEHRSAYLSRVCPPDGMSCGACPTTGCDHGAIRGGLGKNP